MCCVDIIRKFILIKTESRIVYILLKNIFTPRWDNIREYRRLKYYMHYYYTSYILYYIVRLYLILKMIQKQFG